jgi:hypothetical protein
MKEEEKKVSGLRAGVKKTSAMKKPPTGLPPIQ